MNKSSAITSNLPLIKHYSSSNNNNSNNSNSEISRIIKKNKEKYCYLSRIYQQPEIKDTSYLILQSIDIYILHYIFNYLVSSFLHQEDKDFPLPIISLNNNKEPNDMLFLFTKINEYYYHTIHNYYILKQQFENNNNNSKSIYLYFFIFNVYLYRNLSRI